MLSTALARIRSIPKGVLLLRPRTIAHLVKSVAQFERQLAELAQRAKHLESELSTVVRREQQLRAVALADAASDRRMDELECVLRSDAVSAHVQRVMAAACLQERPFPHVVVDDLLPDDLYDALIAGLPPVELFLDRPVNKQQLTVPFDLAPAYSRRVWGYMAERVAPRIITPAVLGKFQRPLATWVREHFPLADDALLAAASMTCSDGRILLRRPGYYIPPHRDPKWGFITCLLYLSRPGDDERWGTQLHTVEGDQEARGAQPHWIDEQACTAAGHIAFRRNRALIFLNSVGAHSARIPPDAQPPDLQRYAYQFRIGAGTTTIRTLLTGASAEQRALWGGKVSSGY